MALLWVITKLQPASEAYDEPHPLEFQQAKEPLEYLLTAALLLIWMFASKVYLYVYTFDVPVSLVVMQLREAHHAHLGVRRNSLIDSGALDSFSSKGSEGPSSSGD